MQTIQENNIEKTLTIYKYIYLRVIIIYLMMI